MAEQTLLANGTRLLKLGRLVLAAATATAVACAEPGAGAPLAEPAPAALDAIAGPTAGSGAIRRTAAVRLGAYNADIHQTSVSGISSGGYMAVQFHVAFSSILTGVGVFAGGPYHCAGSSGMTTTALSTCMEGSPAADLGSLIDITDRRATAGDLDPTSNLGRQKVWLFSGTKDTKVKRPVMDWLNQYYQHYVPAGSIAYKTDIPAAHAHITDNYGNSCGTLGSPYINNCGYDAEGALLQHIYGPLLPRNTGTLSGQLIQFDQSEFLASPTSKSMDTTGWVYVPAACAKKEACKVHVALHGCEQSQAQIHDAYYGHAGYNQWADTNHLIILYPQTVISYFSPTNPKACWDWWGYNDGASYDTKRGVQMAAIKKMVDRLTSGAATLPAPTGLTVTGTADTTVSLSWNAVAGAASYHLYRTQGGAAVAVGGDLMATTFTDSGLSPGTTYSYKVLAVGMDGSEGEPSSTVSATTTGHPPPPPPILPPTGLSVTATTADSVSLSWSPSTGAAGYNVYRAATSGGSAAKVNPALLTATTFTDKGLAASTTYYYTAKAQASDGTQSAASAEVAATTAAPATCYRDNNWNHFVAGRATNCFGFACATGSGQNMGLLNILTVTSLKQTGPMFYVIGTCP